MTARLRVFISSPADVAEERALAERVFLRLGQEFTDRVHLEVVLWEHEPLFGHAGFQEQIERPSRCDLVVSILWSRLGTRLPSDFSPSPGQSPPTGTEFEIRDALEAYQRLGKPNLLIYRKSAAPNVNLASDDAEERLRQYRLLDDFCRHAFYDEQGAVLVAHHPYAEAYEFERKLTEHVRKWLEQRVGDAAIRPRWTTGSPYRGLQPFEAEHREIYFGRSQALSELVGRLRDTETRAAAGDRVARFLLVQGMSGNGKSSLIRAGLLPLLEGRALEGIGLWRQVILKPSDRSEHRPDAGVVGALVAALSKTLPPIADSYPDTAQLVERVRNAPNESAARLDGYLTQEAIRVGLSPDRIRLVVFTDQLEELFEQSFEQAERLVFIALLDALAREGRIWVIATVRSDFAARIEEHPALINLTREGHLYLLGPPQSDELGEMIREPAQAAGLQWETRAGVSLDQAILREATANPESLPLLEYALDQLYERHSGRSLTYADYEAIGGLKGGIAQSAEAVLTNQQDVASSFPSLMRSLVSVDESGTATRRYAPLTEFAPGTPERALLDALVARRLCVADQRGDEAVVSFAHEALIQSWPRVTDWLQLEAALLQTRDLALRDARLWQQHGESEAWLASPDKLVAFKALESAHLVLPDQGWRFIERSRRHVQRVTRIKQLAVGMIAVLAVGASIGAWIAIKKQREAEHQTALTRHAQMQSLTEAAASRLKDGELSYARGIILEVLKNEDLSKPLDPSTVNVFQEVRASDPLSAVLAGQLQGGVRNVAYSPDGTRIVTASYDGTARVWDARTGIQLSILLREPKSVVMYAAYSRDGTRIITSAGGVVKIWDAQTGALLHALTDAAGKLGSAAFSPDGSRVVTSLNKTARVWDARTGDPLITFPDQGREVFFTAYSPAGAEILTIQADNTARILDARSGMQLAVLSGHTDDLIVAAYSPDGLRVVTGSADGTARIWNARSGALLFRLPLSEGQVWAVAFSPDGKTIATGDTSKKVRIWEAATGTQLKEFEGHTEIIAGVAYSPDGSHLVSAGLDGTARIWDVGSGPASLILAHKDEVSSVAYSPDGSRIVTASENLARLWDARSGAELAVLSGHSAGVNSVEYSHDGTKILTSSRDHTARIWDARSGASLKVLSGPDGVLSASFSLDDGRIVAAFENLTFGIWDAHTGVSIANRRGHRDYINSIRYSPDGKRILTASVDKTARIWDANLRTQLANLQHVDYLNSGRYSPDGKRIVTTTNDTAVRIWDADNATQIMAMLGHQRSILDAAFSPDGSRVVSASLDRTIRIWNARTGTQLAVLPGHTDRVDAVVYSPDGTHIASASRDKTARIWDAEVPADLPGQIFWAQAAEADPLTELQTRQLGLPPAAHMTMLLERASACDREAAAFYDPERRAPGVEQARINAETAKSACLGRANDEYSARRDYQTGRALLGNDDTKGAISSFERAVSKGYPAALVDLADLLTDPSAKKLDPARAASLYQQAWNQGVSIAGFKLGQLYERGISEPGERTREVFHPNPSSAWLWYGRAAAVRECDAIARFAERAESNAMSAESAGARNAKLLEAFRLYARAAELARAQDWPDSVWRAWRYRRATLARVLAREGMMQEVADSYRTVVGESVRGSSSFLERLRGLMH